MDGGLWPAWGEPVHDLGAFFSITQSCSSKLFDVICNHSACSLCVHSQNRSISACGLRMLASVDMTVLGHICPASPDVPNMRMLGGLSKVFYEIEC